jgi:Flp pilus assembly protein TadG
MTRFLTRPLHPFGRFTRETRGSVSVEMIIVLPLLIWALAATVVFYDGFRTRYHAQMAAQTVADIMSRETSLFTASYVEGMNEVFDFLVDASIPTRIRVSSVIWDSVNERNRLQWSYATRDLSALPGNTFELMQAEDYDTLRAQFGDDESFSFASADAQMPTTDLPSRIPPVLPGEAMLLVETFALWTPFANVGMGEIRFTPVVAVRPRFAPWINFDGVEPVYPEPEYEIAWTGGGNDSLPDPNETIDDPIDPDAGLASYNFDTGVTTGWSQSTTTTGSPAGGSFLGPFGTETYDTPVSLAVNLGTSPETATIEFDLLVLDTWDGYGTRGTLPRGDTFSILFDGTPISLDAFESSATGFYDNDRVASGYLNGMHYQVRMTLTRRGDSFHGWDAWDSVWHAVLTLDNPPAQFDLGFSAGVNAQLADESFGIDNLVYTSTGTNTGTPFYAPSPLLANGVDPFTRFNRYSGCPDYQISAPWLNLNNDDLAVDLSFERQAGGPTDIGDCNFVRGNGRISSEPQLIMNYDNLGQTGRGDRLKIALNDGNNGYSCDTTILVRDPNGQWWFNDDSYSRYGSGSANASLYMGSAASGQYAIWLGTAGSRQCNSRITFSDY